MNSGACRLVLNMDSHCLQVIPSSDYTRQAFWDRLGNGQADMGADTGSAACQQVSRCGFCHIAHVDAIAGHRVKPAAQRDAEIARAAYSGAVPAAAAEEQQGRRDSAQRLANETKLRRSLPRSGSRTI